MIIIISACKNEDKRIGLIQGVWGESKDSNSDFKIKGHKITYFEDPEKCDIEFKYDSLIIFQNGEVLTSYKIIYISKENLELKALEGNVLKLVKISD